MARGGPKIAKNNVVLKKSRMYYTQLECSLGLAENHFNQQPPIDTSNKVNLSTKTPKAEHQQMPMPGLVRLECSSSIIKVPHCSQASLECQIKVPRLVELLKVAYIKVLRCLVLPVLNAVSIAVLIWKGSGDEPSSAQSLLSAHS
jgi:hypothetical protein